MCEGRAGKVRVDGRARWWLCPRMALCAAARRSLSVYAARGPTPRAAQAWAGAHFTRSVARALKGESGVVECTFVDNDKAAAKFFSTPVELGVRASPLAVSPLAC